MTTYTVIPDADIEPDQPIKSSTAFALRDNLTAVIEGDASAPKITSRTISPGGSQADGACIDATAFPGPGFFDFSTFTITAPKTMPFATFIRVDGNATLSSVLTVRRTFASADNERAWLACLGGAAPDESETEVTVGARGTGGGGGVVGDGGDGDGGTLTDGALGLHADSLVRAWAARRALVGGNAGNSAGANGGAGGGFLVLVVNGDLDATGGTINASGANGNTSGANASGGGGGGCIIIICTGTITGGTYNVSGGNGGNDTGDGGGGGGGLVILVATGFAGTRTKTVTGGTGPGAATDGGAGASVESALTAGQINALLLGAQ
jgi:hypothetical protein